MNIKQFFKGMFLVLSMLFSSVYAVSPGMIVALLQGLESYGPEAIKEILRNRCFMDCSSTINSQKTRTKLYCGLRGFSYEKTVSINNIELDSYKLDYVWSPYNYKNVVVRSGMTMMISVCSSSFIDLLFGNRSLREICTSSYLARSISSGISGSLLGIMLKKIDTHYTMF